MTINNFVNADKEKLVSILDNVRKQQEKNDLDIEKNKSSLVNTRKKIGEIEEPLLKQIEKAIAPYKKEEDVLEVEERKLRDKKWDLQKEVDAINRKILLEEAKMRDRFDVPSFTAYLRGLNITIPSGYKTEAVIEKKELVNGIQIFRVIDEGEFSEWFFFYNIKLVGFSYRRAGRHQGDETTPYSFFAPCNKVEDVFKIEKPHKWNKDKKYLVNATFSEFAEEIENKDPEKLNEIDLSDDAVMDIIRNHKRLDW